MTAKKIGLTLIAQAGLNAQMERIFEVAAEVKLFNHFHKAKEEVERILKALNFT